MKTRFPFHTTQARQAGFTLVELLAVVVITAVISVVSVGVFVNSQVKGNKARSMSEVRQQGEFLLDHINFLIRSSRTVSTNAEGLVCEPGMDSLGLESYAGTTTVLSLQDDVLASNSAGLSSGEIEVSGLNFDCTQADGLPGAFITYQFTITVGADSTSPDTQFQETFQSQVTIRSY